MALKRGRVLERSKTEVREMTRRRGFTLVELLVVIAIIGLLVALLLPAVNAAREQGRLATCKNNLHQLQVACEHHVDKLQVFPSGGWGKSWVGIADQGYGANQPGGWIYQLLPYMDQGALHDLDKGLTLGSGTQQAASAKRVSTPVSSLYCPTRRAAKAYPLANIPLYTTFASSLVAGRTDYAANGGSVFVQNTPSPTSLPVPPNFWSYLTNTSVAAGTGFTGIVSIHSEITPASVPDNKDTTYLIGEKYMQPENYITGIDTTGGRDTGDVYSAMSGDDVSLIRWTCLNCAIGGSWTTNPPSASPFFPPAQDRSLTNNPPLDGYRSFGSSHSAGWQVAFVGGNAQLIGWAIDPYTHIAMSTRNGHEVIDPTKIPH
jgi:prepilin-type N-terminal cleavage/methylation domain-containing protein